MRALPTLLALALLALPALAQPTLHLDPQTQTLQLQNFPQSDPSRFQLYVDSKSRVPPLAGTFRQQGDTVIFEPKYPLGAGLRLRAEYRETESADPIVAFVETPARDRTPTTSVEAVYPTQSNLPENLLKFYLHFSAPMSRGIAYQHVHLYDAENQSVDLAFLEIEQELWDSESRRLTIFFDPGRVKRELVPNEEVGTPLREGQSYRLVIDASWSDAKGKPLTAEFEKPFEVSEPDYDPPETKTWTIEPPPAGSPSPLTIQFPEPMDSALAPRMINVHLADGTPIPGEAELTNNETRWQFNPDIPWQAGRYAIEANTSLEDLAGNSLGRPFEVDVFEKVEEQVYQVTERIPFEIVARP